MVVQRESISTRTAICHMLAYFTIKAQKSCLIHASKCKFFYNTAIVSLICKIINDILLKNLTFQTGQKKMGQREEIIIKKIYIIMEEIIIKKIYIIMVTEPKARME